jgi:hypothetical protein
MARPSVCSGFTKFDDSRLKAADHVELGSEDG